jgi:hypothetical protein
MKPSCAVLNPMTQMIRLFAAASTQPSQHLLPTRIVEKIVSTQDKQSSRNTSESTSSFISTIFPRIWRQLRRSRMRGHNLGNLPEALSLASVAASRISKIRSSESCSGQPEEGLELFCLAAQLNLGSGFLYAYYPAFWAIPTMMLSEAAAAATFGLINSIGQLGGFAGNYAIGFLNDRTHSLAASFAFISVVYVAAGGLILSLRVRDPIGVSQRPI